MGSFGHLMEIKHSCHNKNACAWHYWAYEQYWNVIVRSKGQLKANIPLICTVIW
uniref:Uncharacterized protein n=1 Tax=Rhizophora mucronata TaxID=61149 RepID=A0A2P2QHF6_RHIMU